VRATAREEIRCGVMINAALGQHESRDRVEAGFLEGIEAPVEHTLVLAPARTLSEVLFHSLSFGSKAHALNGRRDRSITRTRDARTSPERGMPGSSPRRRIDRP
jgi:hypothetical protein